MLKEDHDKHEGKYPTSTITSTSTNDVTILGIGSLLSETSSRMTFPKLINFRLGRVMNYRRVFAHTPSVFVQREIGNFETLELSSLSAEHDPTSKDQTGFICSVFEIPQSTIEEETDGALLKKMDDGTIIPSEAFLKREEEFNIITVPFIDYSSSTSTDAKTMKEGILCTKSTDEEFIKRWGPSYFQKNYIDRGLRTIWNWSHDSNLKPCAVYLRHCVLAAQKMGLQCYHSFLDETYLVDRRTTIRTYLENNPHIMTTHPPPHLSERYGG